jgi:hypothetical protein
MVEIFDLPPIFRSGFHEWNAFEQKPPCGSSKEGDSKEHVTKVEGDLAKLEGLASSIFVRSFRRPFFLRKIARTRIAKKSGSYATAYEPQLINCETEATVEIGCLLLTPGEIESCGEFEQIGPVSIEEIGDRATADVTEEAQWPPKPLQFETTAVAEREEGGIPQHVPGNNYGTTGSSWVINKSDAVCCVNAWHEALQSAVLVSGLQCGRADARNVNERIVQHEYVTVLQVCRYPAGAGYQIRLDSVTEQAAASEVVCEFHFP